jgi:hypothetical protein
VVLWYHRYTAAHYAAGEFFASFAGYPRCGRAALVLCCLFAPLIHAGTGATRYDACGAHQCYGNVAAATYRRDGVYILSGSFIATYDQWSVVDGVLSNLDAFCRRQSGSAPLIFCVARCSLHLWYCRWTY